MKKCLFAVVLIALVGVLEGCGSISSRTEVIYATQQLPDYDRLISVTTFNLRWLGIAFSKIVVSNEKENIMSDNYACHLVVYQAKSKEIRTILWNSDRPPKKFEVKSSMLLEQPVPTTK